MVSGRLLPDALYEFAIFLADFLRFGECAASLMLQTAEVSLHVADVGLEVLLYNIGILFCGLRIGWDKRPFRRITGLSYSDLCSENQQCCKGVGGFSDE